MRLAAIGAALLLAAGVAACGSGSGEFTATQHSDSGGGSQPYIVPGSDNSMQEYGSEAPPAEFEVAAAALHEYLDARAEDNWQKVCGVVSRPLIKSFEELAEDSKELRGKGCAAILKGFTEASTSSHAAKEIRQDAEESDVRSLRVQGKQGFVIYTAGDRVIGIGVLHEDGTWKVSNLTGTPLT